MRLRPPGTGALCALCALLLLAAACRTPAAPGLPTATGEGDAGEAPGVGTQRTDRTHATDPSSASYPSYPSYPPIPDTPDDAPETTGAAMSAAWPRAARRLGLPWLAQGPPLLAGAATSAPPELPQSVTPAAVAATAGPGGLSAGPCAGMVGRQGGTLVLEGRPWRFFGVNATYLTEPDFPEAEVGPLLEGLAKRRVNALRVWFRPGQDPERFQRLLDQGGRQGLRFLVSLGDNVHDGVDWFFGEEDEGVYRPHLEATVRRFAGRPEILAWEPLNEPNCGDGRFDETCVKTIRDWVVGTARSIRGLDACHLVSSGMIGAGNFDLDQDSYRRLHKKDEIDLISVHRDIRRDADLELELAADADKPIVYGEIYDIANDEGCSPLGGAAGPAGRAGRVADDLAQAWQDGVDGYLLWDLNLGQVRKTNGDRGYYCSKFGYALDDPVWGRVADLVE